MWAIERFGSNSQQMSDFVASLKPVRPPTEPRCMAPVIRATDPVLRAALAIRSENGPLCWEIESTILAELDDHEIAARCRVPAEVVSSFESTMFCVRANLSATDWIMSSTVRLEEARFGPKTNFGPLWRYFGFIGGVHVLDAVIRSCAHCKVQGWPLMKPPGEDETERRVRHLIAVQFFPFDTPLTVCREIEQAGQDYEHVDAILKRQHRELRSGLRKSRQPRKSPRKSQLEESSQTERPDTNSNTAVDPIDMRRAERVTGSRDPE
jgi:hypothetical protein